jgi:glycosyltransferase A (GT-A) superfamily protein (DUF2064 family)
LSATLAVSYSTSVPRRAVLIFADEINVDRARRSFPRAAQPLLSLAALSSQISPEADLHLFTSAGDAIAAGPRVHQQAGRDFAARFENAVEEIAQLGYDEIVVIGRDCPALRPSDIECAFAELVSKRLVLGPDHRGGCYLIAFHSADRELLHGIRWKKNTDCAQLRDRCGDDACFLLPVKHDLDSWADLQMFARADDSLARLAAFLVRLIFETRPGLFRFVSLASQRMRVRQQMPPPAFAA